MAAFSALHMKHSGEETAAPVSAEARRRGQALAEALVGHAPSRAYSPIVIAGCVRFLDLSIVLCAGAGVRWFYLTPEIGRWPEYAVAMALVACASVVMFQALGINQLGAFRQPVKQGFRLICGLALVFLAALALIFFLKLEGVYSRVWLAAWFGVSAASLMIERALVSGVVRRLAHMGQLDRRTVIVGGGPAADELLSALQHQDTDLRIYGFFDDRTGDRSPDVVAGFPKLGNVDDLVEFARHARIDLVIFTLPITAEQRLLSMLRKLWVLPIDIRLSAHSNKLKLRPRSYSYIGGVPVLDVFDKPIADWDVVLKSAFDRIVGALCLVLLAPLFALIAICIKLDSKGPVFFRQRRHGFNNETVEVWKFRSLRHEAADYAAARQVTRDDPRVTRVGRIIRKTSLDELPQLFNVVFKGDLSLVGPRPHAIGARAADYAYDEVVDGYFARHRVRPGVTGWAQVNGWRGETDTPEKLQRRVEHDLYYIENWSILFDLYILAITPFALLKAENAY